MRLFHRSTRRLRLTEGGERFLQQVDGPLASLQAAVANLDDRGEDPAGTLKVSMGQAFGRNFLVPLLGDFLERYPRVLPDWHFDNRQVDIVGEGFDAAVGGGFPLASGVVARELAPVHIVAVAVAGLPGRASDAAQPCGSRGLRRHHAALFADRPRAALVAALAARRGA